MNTPEQLRLAADIVEKKLPFEYLEAQDGCWCTNSFESPAEYIVRGIEIRVKPPYAELQAAYEAGKVVQARSKTGGVWLDLRSAPIWHPGQEYRVKPEPPDPYAELKAAHAAGKVIEVLVCGDWCKTQQHPRWDAPVTSYRVKPWTLPCHIAGLRALRDGEVWHREDWQEGWLAKGERPLLLGEAIAECDAFRAAVGAWCSYRGAVRIKGGTAEQVSPFWYKTTRPLPPVIKKVPLEARDWIQNGPWWVCYEDERAKLWMVNAVEGDEIKFRLYAMSFTSAMERLKRTNDGVNFQPCYKEVPDGQ